MAQNLLKDPGSCLKLKNGLEIAQKKLLKYPGSSSEKCAKNWQKPPKTTFSDIEKCDKNVKKETPKMFWFFFTKFENVLKSTKKSP